MAKDLTPTELATALRALGMPVPEELEAKVSNEVEDAAIETIAKALAPIENDETDPKDVASLWQSRLFGVAASMTHDFKVERNNVGRGQADQIKLTIDTPDGTMFLRLSRTVESK